MSDDSFNFSDLETKESDVNLSQVYKLVKQLEQAEEEVSSIEETLKAKKQLVEELKTRTIPDAMGGLTQVKTDTGAIVIIDRIVRANIPKDQRPEAFNWLDRAGHGGIIKTEILLSYPRNQLEAAKATVEQLKGLGLNPQLEQEVHWATLNAWAKDQLDKGLEFPNFIGIFEGKTTKVKYGK